MKANIVWRERNGRGHTGWDGYAGTLSLVSVHYTSQRTGPKWLVRTQLPIVIPDSLVGHDDETAAKVMAERLLAAFLRTIGAGWK